jgi:hypothetical protein
MQTRFVSKFGLIGAAVALVLGTASCAFVSGPVAPSSGISLTSGFDPAQVGYERSEFFLGGFAASYAPTAALTGDGKWSVAPQPTTPDGAFKTRMVVFRPTDPARFNGTVVVEWLNVSAGADLPTDWIMAHNEFIRKGYAYVGVSAQAVGVNNLKTLPRYASLVHPGDSYSYDIFTRAGQRVRDQAATVLGGLHPQRILATGESQSASRLVTYINAIHPLVHVYDGFMVHSRSAGGARISQSPLPDVSVPSPAPIRNDLDVPVMVVEAEGDVINSNLGARQPDTAMFREWELAGTSHADAYTTTVGFGDIGDGRGAAQMLDLMQHPPVLGCGRPINTGPHHWILQAAFRALDTWVRTGVRPPVANPLVVTSTSPVVLARDAQGNALGGVRSPQVDAPIATLDAVNSGPSFCFLFGSTTPLTPPQLSALYPTHQDFVTKWAVSLFVNSLNGFLLPDDVSELYSAAVAAPIPS